MKDLASVDVEEQRKFFDSFDLVLTDCDGVIWMLGKPYSYSASCIRTLKEIGKKVHYVSNNSMITLDRYYKLLQSYGFELDSKHDVICPHVALISYLKSIKFDKSIYVVGFEAMRTELKEAGYKVVEIKDEIIEEKLDKLLPCIADTEEVGAVVLDLDLNATYLALQRAVTYLRRKDCLFITGATEVKLPINPEVTLLGPDFYQKAIEFVSQREPYGIGKPSINLNKVVIEKYNVTNPERLLFIGDSVPEDMAFATKCGYQKLLVLSGFTKPDQLANWPFNEEYKPQYYVENLGKLEEIIRKLK